MDPMNEVESFDSMDTGYWTSASSVASDDSMEAHWGSGDEQQ